MPKFRVPVLIYFTVEAKGYVEVEDANSELADDKVANMSDSELLNNVKQLSVYQFDTDNTVDMEIDHKVFRIDSFELGMEDTTELL